MRRITIWLMSTISALVLLFSYPTSTSAKHKSSVQSLDQGVAGAGSTGSTTDSATGSTDSSTDSGSGGSGGTASGNGQSTDDSAAADPSTSGGTSGDSGSTGSGSTDSGTSGSGGSASAGTFTGDSVMTRWGVVQVAITVKGGKITRSEVVQVPWDNPRDQQINAYAVPILNQEVVSAQSAQIDMVSGATVTSEGYIQSLQSAIDQAHLS